jgi:hypothetical protein
LDVDNFFFHPFFVGKQTHDNSVHAKGVGIFFVVCMQGQLTPTKIASRVFDVILEFVLQHYAGAGGQLIIKADLLRVPAF